MSSTNFTPVVPDKNTPITEEFLKEKFKPAIKNAGNLHCYTLQIITHSSKELVIAKWLTPKKGEEQLWQVWIESFDLCRIKYIEQLGSLIIGLDAKIDLR